MHCYLQTAATISNIPESILRPAQTTLSQSPQPLCAVLTRSSSSDVNRKQVVKGRMGLSGIGPLQQLRHGFLAVLRGGGYSVFERFVEASSIRERSGIPKAVHHIAQIVDCHARCNDENIVFSEVGDCLPEAVVLHWVLSLEERNLDDRHVQGVFIGFECCQS